MVSPALTWLLAPPDVAARSAARETGVAGLPPGLTGSELSALVAEGLVVAVAGAHLPADAAQCPAARASLLAPRLDACDVVAGAAALWLHGVVPECGVVDVLLAERRSGGSRRDPAWRRTRAAVVPEEQVVEVCRVRVTTLERAAADVALWHDPEEAAPLLTAAVGAGADPRLALEALAGSARPGLRRGRERLRGHLTAQAALRPVGCP